MNDEEVLQALTEIHRALQALYTAALPDEDRCGLSVKDELRYAARHIRRLDYVLMYGVKGIESQDD